MRQGLSRYSSLGAGGRTPPANGTPRPKRSCSDQHRPIHMEYGASVSSVWSWHTVNLHPYKSALLDLGLYKAGPPDSCTGTFRGC